MKNSTMINEQFPSFSIRARLRSFSYAWKGLIAFFSMQHNAIIHLVVTLLTFAASVFFNVSKGEAVALVIAAGLVWTSELFNTAIEKLADEFSKEFHPSVKFIKDVSAAAVLLSAVAAFITGSIIFLPKLLM